ncbi:MAG: hypothetical protein WCK67_02280 [bacterium]
MNIKKIILSRSLFLIMLASFVFVTRVEAQQAILNIPSTDVLQSGKTSIRLPVRFRIPYPEFVNGNPSLIQGIGYHSEFYMGVPVGNQRDTTFGTINSRVDLNVGMKSGFNITKYTKFALGAQITPSLQHNQIPANLSYYLFSQQIPNVNSKVTAGMYLRNRNKFIQNVPGVLLGYEQTIIKDKVIAVIDWTSRNEPYGLLATGLIIKPTKTITLKGGVLIPNGNKAKLGYIISLSKTIDTKSLLFWKSYK